MPHLNILLAVNIMFSVVCISANTQCIAAEDSGSLLSNAIASIDKGEFNEAKLSLQAMLEGMPKDWKAIDEKDDGIHVAYWDKEHFLACSNRYRQRNGTKFIVWSHPSYAKAYYLLAYMSIESKNTNEAEIYINKALELEPNNPILLDEKGIILQHMGDHDTAIKSFNSVIDSTECVNNHEKAKALRGKGISLIELGKLDDAENAFKESLAISPNNKVALNELRYIHLLRSGIAPSLPIELSK